MKKRTALTLAALSIVTLMLSVWPAAAAKPDKIPTQEMLQIQRQLGTVPNGDYYEPVWERLQLPDAFVMVRLVDWEDQVLLVDADGTLRLHKSGLWGFTEILGMPVRLYTLRVLQVLNGQLMGNEHLLQVLDISQVYVQESPFARGEAFLCGLVQIPEGDTLEQLPVSPYIIDSSTMFRVTGDGYVFRVDQRAPYDADGYLLDLFWERAWEARSLSSTYVVPKGKEEFAVPAVGYDVLLKDRLLSRRALTCGALEAENRDGMIK